MKDRPVLHHSDSGRRRTRLRGGAIHGREPELRAVAGLVRGAVTGRGGAMLIEGELGAGKSLLLSYADAVARTETAKPYVAGKRLYGLVPNQTKEGEKDLAYAFDMAAMGQPLTPHLWAVLQWDWID